MTGWVLFFTILGVAFLTAQLFRLIDLIERPSHPAACRKTIPEARTLLLWTALRKRSWTFWKS